MTDDAELLRRYAEEKSDEAFAEFVRRHIDFVYATALRQGRGNMPLAQDITQTVFTDLARKAAELARHPVAVGWLHAATRFAASKAIRAESRRTAREQEACAMNEALGEPSSRMDWERLQPVLDEVLGELKERERTAILLRFFERKPFAEVGRKLALTESAARSCVDRALEKMRGQLARRGVTSTSGALAVALANQTVVAAPAGLAATVTVSALAGATTSAASAVAATFFINMSSIKTVTIFTGIAALLATGMAIHEVGRSRAAESALTALSREAGALRAGLERSAKEQREAVARAQAAETSTASLQKENDRLRRATATVAPADLAARHEEAINQLVVSNPELRKLYARQQTVRFRVRYGPLYQALGFTPEQVGEFERIRGENVLAQSDIFKEGLAQGLAKSDPIVQDLVKQANKQQEDSLRTLLGDAGVQQLQTYERTLPLRNVANTLADSVYFTDTPLTAKQADQLTEIVVQTLRNSKGEGNLGTINWPAVLAKSPTVLTPVQQAALSTMVEQAEVGKKVYAIVEPVLNSQGLSIQDNYPSPPAPAGGK